MSRKKKKIYRITTLFIRGLRKDVKDGYKAWCSLRGLTMTRDLESYMLSRMNEDRQNELR